VDTFLSSTRIQDLASFGQLPFSIVVTCSDSRIPIELIFDRGFGDLFVIRNFGNLIDPLVLASIEYAILHFNLQLIVIMGHSKSGAVRVTMENENKKSSVISPSISRVIEKIKPSLTRARMRENYFESLESRSEKREKIFQETSFGNILNSKAEMLSLSEIIRSKVEKKELYIVPTMYEISSGQLTFELSPELRAKIDKTTLISETKLYGKTVLEILGSSTEESEKKGKSG
jgi:carbonic anhydrase